MKYFSRTPISSHFYPDNAIKNTAVKRYFSVIFTARLLPIKHERIYVMRSNDSITLITSHEALSISLTTVIDPSHSFRMTLAVRRHSERRQECLVGKTENGTVTQSEESMTSDDSLSAFLTTATDSSLVLRMTFNVSLIMTPCRLVSF